MDHTCIRFRPALRALPTAVAAVLVALGAAFGAALPASAQTGTIAGTVREAGGATIGGAAVTLLELDRTVTTGAEGAFLFDRLPAGSYRVEVTRLGYQSVEIRARVAPGETTTLAVDLEVTPIRVPGVRVSAVRPDLVPEAALDQDRVRQANPRDPGELVRALPGVDAVRRGPIGLDPSVRGLRETEVGAYVDGARTFPAGPARMDSQLGHIDPSAIRRIEVVKGPYALTWGAGNLAAVRVETQEVPPDVVGAAHGTLTTGYDGNLNAAEASGSLFGESGGVSYWAQGSWRKGDDYTSGDGTLVPGDFTSAEGRGKVGFQIGESGQLTLGGGYQQQDDIDYPGRLLNALFFKTANGSAELNVRPAEGSLRSLQVLFYGGNVKHNMTNLGKPTALPNPNRMPPFALDVGVETESTTFGGRGAAQIAAGSGWELELGGDLYTVNRDAVRTVARQDNGMELFVDQVWPDVRITDVGTFLRATRQLGETARLSGTARVDFVSADAGRPTDFFLDNAGAATDQSETNLSGALTLAVDLSDTWTLSTGLGSVVRTADALERYSDRFPASKAQIAAEFIGNPALDPERSTQVDIWLEGSYDRVSFDFNGFTRWMSDYITLEPTSLPKRLPLSPDVVFRYVNGAATFRGFETSVAVAVTDEVTTSVGVEYLWGEDTELDEPAIGIAPFTASFLARYDHPTDRFYTEAGLRTVAEQDRVATTRGELVTPGYTTLDLRAGVRFGGGIELRGGALNLFDEQYVNHLNSKNPFSGIPIPEPGRVLFVDLSLAF